MIYDCFTYFNEEAALEIRINEFKKFDVVHILVESEYSFTGIKKEANYSNSDKKYNNIKNFICNDIPNNGNPWDNESYQRNYIKKVLLNFNLSDDDIVIISDVDEIPNSKSFFNFEKTQKTASLIMDHYACYFNLLQSKQSWPHAKIMTWEYLKQKSPQEIRHEGNLFKINNGGWHFGWLGGVEKMLLKLKSFSHQELEIQKIADENILQEKLDKNESLWSKDIWKLVKLDSTFPEYLYKNQDKFQNYIKKWEN